MFYFPPTDHIRKLSTQRMNCVAVARVQTFVYTEITYAICIFFFLGRFCNFEAMVTQWLVQLPTMTTVQVQSLDVP